MNLRQDDHNTVAGWLADLESKAAAPLASGPDYGYGLGFGSWGMLGLDGTTAAPADVPAHLNVIVSACIGWLSRAFPLADLRVTRKVADQDVAVVDHPFIVLMDRPNPLDTFHSFWQAYLISDVIDGNSFFVKVRTKDDRGIHSLWWVPPWDVTVVPNRDESTNADTPIARYDVKVGGKTKSYKPDEIIHIKDGKDPADPYRGMAALKASQRSRSTIDRAEMFSETLMRNCGAIPVVVSPSIPEEMIDRSNIPALKAQWEARQTGMNNGTPFFSTNGLRVDRVALSPEEMAIDKIYDWPVSFICSQIGLAPMVIGLPDPGKTFSNYEMAERGAWQNALIPRQERAAEAFDKQCSELIDRRRERLIWDYSHVKALQDDWLSKLDGLTKATGKPVLTVNEGRALIHLPPIEGGDELPASPVPAPVLPPPKPMAALPSPDAGKSAVSPIGEKSEPSPAPGLSTKSDKPQPPTEREDDPLPFSFSFKDDMPPLVQGDQPDPHEDNTYGLPDGLPLAEKLKRAYEEQAAAVLGTIPTIGASLPASFPPLSDYDDPMASAMTPILSAYWDAAGKTTLGKLGLDPDDWKVTDPNVRAKIAGATLAFCQSTNETTGLRLNDALAKLREELTAGIVDEGETIPQLRKRVKAIFGGLTDQHAEVIARTETARAVHAASLQSAMDSEVVESKRILLSSNACPLCVKIEAETKAGVALDGTFARVGNHPVYAEIKTPPLHVSCRCTLLYDVSAAYRAIVEGETGQPVPESVAPLDPKQKPITRHSSSPATRPKIAVVAGDDTVLRTFHQVMGRSVSLDEIANLIGAQAGMTVEAVTAPDSVYVTAKSDHVEMIRMITKGSTGPVIKNLSILIDEDQQGKGIGSQIFADQVEHASRLGVAKLQAFAARDEGLNGYYTWPRLGYDAPIPDRTKLPESLAEAAHISDLMKTSGGRAWWKSNGIGMHMDFDLAEGSQSRRVLDAYRTEKAAREK